MPHRLSLRPTGKHRKQRASDYSVTINGLMTRRSLLIRDKPDTLASDIAAIDYVLKLCGFNEDPQQYMPKYRKRQIFKKGEKLRLIMEALEQADKPLTSREICLAILRDKDVDLSDKRRVNQTTVGVYIVLKRQYDGGRVDRVDGVPVRWVIMGLSDIDCP